ncbi:(2E,6E)-farnesyl diphosphate synthase [Actinomadura rubteroloni]|uniref:(2E,6E)-farnesyl diphosphate synthase n=1 Tax=Actinomadura rubteroloni TaxID=1926885 RepID=A0A2P4UQL4_9ACTN|nr:polyprenyl synthetase family protein [Actinomadura rubteroloni]POM27338.1 (2E,6E)-farnesyl diphosphate synthase [Actinomadura rubteroloni]
MEALDTKLGDNGTSDAVQILAGTRQLLAPALRHVVDQFPSELGRIVGYHLGTHDRNGTPIDGDSGKAVRPALALLACQAVGGDQARALPAAVAVELVHNASLLHDDIIDGDQTRRGRPAVWRTFGVADAILAGDALFFVAIRTLAESLPLAGQGVMILTSTVQQLIEGEHTDLLMEGRPATTLSESQAMATAKTGSLIAAACALGAIAGGATVEQIARMHSFGLDLGLAFQFIDDIKGIWGDPAVTGKPTSDLASGKKSLPVAYALANTGAARAELAALYQKDTPLTPAEQARAADLVEAAGGRAWANERADHHIRQARLHLEVSATDPAAVARLNTLATMITSSGPHR